MLYVKSKNALWLGNLSGAILIPHWDLQTKSFTGGCLGSGARASGESGAWADQRLISGDEIMPNTGNHGRRPWSAPFRQARQIGAPSAPHILLPSFTRA